MLRLFVTAAGEGGCFRWRLSRNLTAATSRAPEAACCHLPTPSERIYVWIDGDGSLKSSTVQQSVQWTRAFYHAGEVPRISLVNDNTPLSTWIRFQSWEWNEELALWSVQVVTVGSLETSVAVVVKSQSHVSFLGCQISDRVMTWSWYRPLGSMIQAQQVSAVDDRFRDADRTLDSRLFVLQHACATNRLLWWSNVETPAATTELQFWLTEKGVVDRQQSPYSVYRFVWNDGTERVKAVGLLDDRRILFLTRRAITLWTNDGTSAVEITSEKLPTDFASWINGGHSARIRTPGICDPLKWNAQLSGFPIVPEYRFLPSVVLISSSIPSSTPYFMYSTDNGNTFKQFTLNNYVVENGLAAISLMDVVVQQLVDGCVIVLREFRDSPYNSNGAYTDQILIVQNLFDSSLSASIQKGFRFETKVSNFTRYSILGGPAFELLPSVNGGASVIAFGPGVYYSMDGGMLFFSVTPGYSLTPVGNSFEEIEQVAWSTGGFYSVLTFNNRVFMGKEGLSELVEASVGLSVEVAALSFTADDRLFMHILPDQSSLYLKYATSSLKSVVSLEVAYPTQLLGLTRDQQLVNVYKSLSACPYLNFVSDLPSSISLDIGESLRISSNVTFASREEDSGLSYSFSKKALKFRSASFLRHASTSTEMQENIDSVTVDGRITDHKSSLRISPRTATYSCNNAGKTSTILASCIPGRFIMSLINSNNESILNPAASNGFPCQLASDGNSWTGEFSFSVPAYKYVDISTGNTATAEKVVNYDCGLYGPPITVNYGDIFRPNLGLFVRKTSLGSNGAVMTNITFLTQTTADIVMWEVNGRIPTFKYSSTQQAAGCLRPAQNWAAVTSHWRTNGGLSPFDLWTQKVYSDCTVNDGIDVLYPTSGANWLNQPYEILDQRNGIAWSSRTEGIYVFRVRIIDPEFR